MSSAHKHNDIRIFIKQCRSTTKSGYETHYIVANTQSNVVDGVNIHGVKRKAQGRLNRMLITTKDIYKKAIEIDADIYHFHDPELIPTGLKLKQKGKKVIYDVHEDVAKTILSKQYINKHLRKITSNIYQRYENYAVKKFDYVIAATPFITKRLKKVNSNTITINNYPILSELFSNELKTDKKSQFSYVGGISVNRGVLEVLDAAKDIKGVVKFAGPISSEKTQNLLVKSLNVNYLSIINRKEVKDLLEESLAGVVTFLPEPNHVNAQPNKMFEYMSAGIAVIGSDFPLWKEIIEGNRCGICVNPKSSKEIASAMNYLLDNPDEANEMGERGRRAIEEKYNWEQEEKKLLKVYGELLSSKETTK